MDEKKKSNLAHEHNEEPAKKKKKPLQILVLDLKKILYN